MNPLPVQCRVPGCPGKALVGSRCPVHTNGGGWVGTTPMPTGWSRIRADVLRHEPACRICGAPATTVDHVVARAFGGDESPENLRPLCSVHAREKDRRDAIVGRMRRRAR